MGILQSEPTKTPTSAKRKSVGLDFSSLKPLNAKGTKNFAGYRDEKAQSSGFPDAKPMRKDEDAMDSDADDEDSKAVDDDNDADITKKMLSPEDAIRQGELAEGVRKIKLKRQHSAEPVGRALASPGAASGSANAPGEASAEQVEAVKSLSPTPISAAGAVQANGSSSTSAPASSSNTPGIPTVASDVPPEALVGSPFKKQRASLPGFEEGIRKSLFAKGIADFGNSPASSAAVTGGTTSPTKDAAGSPTAAPANLKGEMSEDEEL